MSLADKESTAVDYPGGNVPTSICTFTNYRKLYFFPGCNSKNWSDWFYGSADIIWAFTRTDSFLVLIAGSYTNSYLYRQSISLQDHIAVRVAAMICNCKFAPFFKFMNQYTALLNKSLLMQNIYFNSDNFVVAKLRVPLDS